MKKSPVQKGRKEYRDEASRFLWHFSDRRFSHDHWWTKQPAEATPEAALWEAMRRHPDIERIISPRYHRDPVVNCAFWDNECQSIVSEKGVGAPEWTLPWFVGSHALKSWQQLLPADRERFITRLKAISPRHRTFCTPPGVLLTKDMLDTGEMWAYGDTIIEMLQRQEHLPIAVDLEADPETVAKWVKQLVMEYQKRSKPAGRRRAHASEWLGVIRLFERDGMPDTPKQHRDSNYFARYRCVIAKSWPKGFQCWDVHKMNALLS